VLSVSKGDRGVSLVHKFHKHLFHRCKESLWIEKSCHPERPGLPVKAPCSELRISVQKLSKPEAKSAWRPRNLYRMNTLDLQSIICWQQQRLSIVMTTMKSFEQQTAMPIDDIVTRWQIWKVCVLENFSTQWFESQELTLVLASTVKDSEKVQFNFLQKLLYRSWGVAELLEDIQKVARCSLPMNVVW